MGLTPAQKMGILGTLSDMKSRRRDEPDPTDAEMVRTVILLLSKIAEGGEVTDVFVYALRHGMNVEAITADLERIAQRLEELDR